MPIPYCLNIHPGESLADTCTAIERYALAVKARVAPGVPYPLGLRLAATAAEELAEPAALEAFRELLARHALYVTGINGFPYGTFHNTAVKTTVYQPDWSTPGRLHYTDAWRPSRLRCYPKAGPATSRPSRSATRAAACRKVRLPANAQPFALCMPASLPSWPNSCIS